LCPTEIDSTANADDHNASSVQPVPVTSLECQWNKRRRRKNNKAEVSNVAFKKHVYGRQRKHQLEPINDFDPRPEEYKNTASQKLQGFLEAMKGKDLGVSVLFDESLRIWEKDAETQEPDKFDLPSNSELIERVQKFKSTLAVTPERIRQIEKDTIDQHQSSLWYAVRQYRLTASTFGKIYHMRPTTAPDSFIKHLLSNQELSTPAVQWEKSNEPVALQRYIDLQLISGCNGLVAVKAGFVISEDFPF